MLLLNIDSIPGRQIEALGVVKGSIVTTKNFGKDFMAGMKTLVGGEIKSYTDMLNEARATATARMVEEAQALGADAVINLRYASSAVMQGGGRGHRLWHGSPLSGLNAMASTELISQDLAATARGTFQAGGASRPPQPVGRHAAEPAA